MAVFRGEAQFAGFVEDALEVQADGGAGFLGDFVFDGLVDIGSAIEQAFQGALILGED